MKAAEATLRESFLREFAAVQDKMIEQHQSEVNSLKLEVEETQRKALESSLIKFEQTKYDDRVRLIKKMHEE